MTLEDRTVRMGDGALASHLRLRTGDVTGDVCQARPCLDGGSQIARRCAAVTSILNGLGGVVVAVAGDESTRPRVGTD
eukprot:7379470-Prymnesium_polylepis.1